MIGISRDPERRGGYILRAETVLPRARAEVFPFFADAMNLERITPPWLKFQVLTPPPIEMFAGQVIDYRLQVHHVPLKWRTEIAEWQPPIHFVDMQQRGPYRWWHHTHLFDEVAGGTRCRDVVRYGVPGGAVAHWLVVRRDVYAIFAYRQRVMHELLGSPAVAQSA